MVTVVTADQSELAQFCSAATGSCRLNKEEILKHQKALNTSHSEVLGHNFSC